MIWIIWEECWFCCFRHNVLYVSVTRYVMFFRSSVFLFIFRLIVLSIIESGIVKSLTNCETVYFSLQFHQFLLHTLWALLLGAYVIIIYIFLMNLFFCEYIMSFFVSCNNFWLNAYFVFISTAAPALFCLLFAWNIFFSSVKYFTLNQKWVSWGRSFKMVEE